MRVIFGVAVGATIGISEGEETGVGARTLEKDTYENKLYLTIRNNPITIIDISKNKESVFL